MNLRIQRIIDFKSIALDHSATLSYTTLNEYPLPDISCTKDILNTIYIYTYTIYIYREFFILTVYSLSSPLTSFSQYSP